MDYKVCQLYRAVVWEPLLNLTLTIVDELVDVMCCVPWLSTFPSYLNRFQLGHLLKIAMESEGVLMMDRTCVRESYCLARQYSLQERFPGFYCFSSSYLCKCVFRLILLGMQILLGRY